MFFWVSKGIREFSSAIVANPHEWQQGGYELVNTKHNDIRIWTANGVFFLQINGNDCLSIAEKFWLSAAIKLSMARRITTPKPEEA